MFYERYADGHEEGIQYVGAGWGQSCSEKNASLIPYFRKFVNFLVFTNSLFFKPGVRDSFCQTASSFCLKVVRATIVVSSLPIKRHAVRHSPFRDFTFTFSKT